MEEKKNQTIGANVFDTILQMKGWKIGKKVALKVTF